MSKSNYLIESIVPNTIVKPFKVLDPVANSDLSIRRNNTAYNRSDNSEFIFERRKNMSDVERVEAEAKEETPKIDVEIVEKDSPLKKIKTFVSEHKKGIIRTGIALAAGTAGLVITKLAMDHATDDYDFDDDFDYSDLDVEDRALLEKLDENPDAEEIIVEASKDDTKEK